MALLFVVVVVDSFSCSSLLEDEDEEAEKIRRLFPLDYALRLTRCCNQDGL
jgi:hypothetical protein